VKVTGRDFNKDTHKSVLAVKSMNDDRDLTKEIETLLNQ
jgi:hypothetical protein